MILRRLSQNLKEQNWIAITIEFVLLVAGVFLGIQVANWNEAQQDHVREAEFVTRLERDFEKIDLRLASNISTWEAVFEAPLRVLDDLEAYERRGNWQRSKNKILRDLSDTGESRIPAPRAATYVELVSAGQLGLIRNTRLRDALLDYDMQVAYSQTAFTVLLQRSEPHLSSIVSHLVFDRSTNATNTSAGPARAQEWSDVSLQGLATDPDLRVALNMYASVNSNQIRVAKLQQEKARAVLALLKSDAQSPGNGSP